MCASSKILNKKHIRHNIYGGKVMFVDRLHTGPNGEILVTELSLQQSGTSVFQLLLMLALLSGVCLNVLWKLQNPVLVYGSLSLILLSFLVYQNFFRIKKEILTVIRCTGIQLTTIYGTGRKQIRFVDLHDISDVVINEAVSMHKIVYYLVILLKANQPTCVIPVFLNSMPRLDTLTDIYATIHDVLWDQPDRTETVS